MHVKGYFVNSESAVNKH